MTGIDRARLKEIVQMLRETFDSNRTVVLISHQSIFVDIADHIVVLGYDGKVVREGKPDEVRDFLALR